MIRHALILATLVGTSMAASAAYAPESRLLENQKNVSIIYKNDVWPVIGPIVVEYCGLEDCSDTPQNDTL